MRRFLLLLALVGLFGSLALANPACINDGTLLSYITANDTFAHSCQIGDKLFWNFQLQPGSGALGAEPTASQIQVQTVPGDGLTNIGISFNTGSWAVSSSIPLDQILSYNVATFSGSALIKDATLTIVGTLTGTGGSGSVVETVFPAVPGTPLTATLPLPVSVNTDFTGSNVATLAVSNRITLVGGRGFSDLAHISSIENDFSEAVPEPVMTLPIGAGLLLVGMARRKQRQRG